MAPLLLQCFGRVRFGSSSSSKSKVDANDAAELSPDEQACMGPVLVELFSSQGCSTSPEAEVVVSRLGRGDFTGEHEGGLPPVAVLGFHVEYWDYRGWKDPFGSSTWTVRQKSYVDSLKLDTLFTPQVVVHGRVQCFGNDLDAISAAVRCAPRFLSPTMKLTSIEKTAPNELKASFHGPLRTNVGGNGVDVMVALHESGLVTDCDGGENKGRMLSNDYVVRRMEKLVSVKDVSARKNISGAVQFDLWDGFNPAKCGLLLFVQNASLQIFGVQQFQIPTTIVLCVRNVCLFFSSPFPSGPPLVHIPSPLHVKFYQANKEQRKGGEGGDKSSIINPSSSKLVSQRRMRPPRGVQSLPGGTRSGRKGQAEEHASRSSEERAAERTRPGAPT